MMSSLLRRNIWQMIEVLRTVSGSSVRLLQLPGTLETRQAQNKITPSTLDSRAIYVLNTPNSIIRGLRRIFGAYKVSSSGRLA